jgi:PAS domain S-box-containing protein
MVSIAELAIGAFGRRREETLNIHVDDAAAILAMSKQPMIIVDGDDGKIIQANAGAYGLLGPPLVGATLDRLVPERHQQAHKEHRSDYMQFPVARPMGVGIKVQAVTAEDGREIPVEIALTPIPTTRLIIAELQLLEETS